MTTFPSPSLRLAALLWSVALVPHSHAAQLATPGQTVSGTMLSLPLTASGIVTSAYASLANDTSGNLLLTPKADAAANDWFLQWNSGLNLSTTTYRYA